MNKDVILEKLENIKNCVQRIESKQPFSLESLMTDFDLQDIITVNIQRAIQSSVDLANHICSEKNYRVPSDMADAFLVLKENGILSDELYQNLSKSVGLRNVLVHKYSGIDWQIVFGVVTQHLDVYKRFAAAILLLS